MSAKSLNINILIATLGLFYFQAATAAETGWVCSYPAFKLQKDEPDSSIVRKFIRQGDYFVDAKFSFDKYKILEDSPEGVVAVRSEAKPKTTYTGIWAYVFLIDKKSGDFRIAHLHIDKASNPLSIGQCTKI